ncbi:MAG TPA: hypothetical protein VJV21_07865 [Pyrinomonadaceae bacterium]|nr:hypothetical protein [Pyrinomonadaceae bacterium]
MIETLLQRRHKLNALGNFLQRTIVRQGPNGFKHNLSTTVVGVAIDGDDFSVKLRIPSVLYKQLFLSRRYRAFVKRVLEELAMPSQWAELKSKLDSWAWIEGDPFPPFYLKKDDTRSKFYNPL